MTWNSSGILGSMKSLRELPLVVWRAAEEGEKLTCGDREGRLPYHPRDAKEAHSEGAPSGHVAATREPKSAWE